MMRMSKGVGIKRYKGYWRTNKQQSKGEIAKRQTEHKQTDEMLTAPSSTFGCPNARATALQAKEPEFCHRTTRIILTK